MNKADLTQQTEQEIVIRRGALTELGTLALLMGRAYANRDNSPLPTSSTQALIGEIETDLNTPGSWAYSASDNKGVVGFAIGFPYSEPDDPDASTCAEYLSLLMVDPHWWGKGIGNRLLDAIEYNARQSGVQHVMLWTRQANNKRTQTIYERRGYKRTGKTKDDGPYGPQYQFQLDL